MTAGRVAAGLALVALAAAASVYLFLCSSLPVTDGTLVLRGLDAEVRVSRDVDGIPTIRAQNQHDADFALGFVHAQDRLFAMDMMRRFGAGRLSEVFGERTIALDRTMRTFGLYRAAETQLAVVSPATRATLEAYAAGVNEFLATRSGALPPEYYILGLTPEPWRPADSLVWGKIMDLELTGNYRGELFRARLLQRLPLGDLAVLFPTYDKDAPIALGNVHADLQHLPLDRLFALLSPIAGPQAASNDWVLDGAHTQSGKPLLANDPHLDFAAPGVWYLARITTPEATLAGVTAPGAPFVIIGHNDAIAWGFTTTGSDVEDLYIEKPDLADPGRYLAPGGPRPFVTHQERIDVQGAAPVMLTVRKTRHGPVISDLAAQPGGDMLALKATWLDDDDRTPQALLELSHAHDWAGFRAALVNFVAPQQNIVYADRDGHVGFIAPARIPIRAKGDGWLPSPGWSGDSEWTGYVPFDRLPQTLDPPSGRIITANNKIVPDDYPYFLTRDWELPYRAERIGELLDAVPRQSPDASAAIEADTLSLAARALLPLMLTIAPADPDAKAVVDRLKRWNLTMDRKAVEPLIYTAWERELVRVVLSDRLGPMFTDYWAPHPDVMQLILTEHQDWCPGGCAGALETALVRALADLRLRYGYDTGTWQWGRVHEAAFASGFWSNVPLLRDWFALSIPVGGADDTVNAAAMNLRDETAPFRDRHGPSLRMIVDMAAPASARFMIVPGQSGNPLSSHWGDLLLPWRDMRFVTIGDDHAGGTLVLRPK